MYAIEIENLHKTYNNKVKALDGVTLKIKKGDFFALLGPNGAGKSTLINILSSLVLKSSGLVKIGGINIDNDFSGAKRLLGVVPQEINLNPFETVEQIVIQQAGYYGVPEKIARDKAEFYLRSLDLWDKRKSQARMLSGGMKRRLMIARALIHEPQILILDEPTAGVDIELRRSMWEFVKKLNLDQKITIILTTHYLEEAEQLCQNVAIIDKGKVLENTTVKDLLSKLEGEIFLVEVSGKLPKTLLLSETYQLNLIDETSFSVSINSRNSINDLVTHLNSEFNLQVKGLRPKSGRLEELFVQLTHKNKGDTKND